jgi:hypothetical protein
MSKTNTNKAAQEAAKKAEAEKAAAEKKAAEEAAAAKAAKKAAEEAAEAAAAKKTGGAGNKVPALSVTCSRDGFRRGGRAWPKGETVVKLSDLNDEQIAQIKGEALLTVAEIEVDE